MLRRIGHGEVSNHPEQSVRIANAPSKGKDLSGHYALVAPIMEQLFGRIPIVWTTYLNDADHTKQFHIQTFGHYSHLSSEHLQHLVSIGAREVYSWFPTTEDETRARFARFLVEGYGTIGHEKRKKGALALREVLNDEGCDAIPMLDGGGNTCLFIPVANAPTYADVRSWCHSIARKAVARFPDLFSEAYNTHHDGRLHIHVSSNAVERFSILPYSYRETSGYVATPFQWSELESIDIHGVHLAELPARLTQRGEIFGELLKRARHGEVPRHGEVSKGNLFRHPSPLDGLIPNPNSAKRVWNNAKGALLGAVVNILADGKPRTADEILAEGKAAGTIDPKTDARAIYIDLTQNIAREKGRGHKPLIVEDPDRRFRINEPLDAWPAVPVQPLPAPSANIQAIIDRLHASSHGDDPTNFEIAVCDAFAALGFLATHLGGIGNPDGYLDAPLGVLGYRSMLECKSGVDIQKDQMVFEAAKYREAYNAQYCIIVGPQFGQRYDIVSELQAHNVSAWSIDALIMALTMSANPLELRPLFESGFAEDRINDILWERNHGECKRVRMVADIMQSVGWLSQTAAAQANSPSTAPLLTQDAAMLLVDQELAAQGAHVNCTREEVRLAFEWLTNPMVSVATWTPDKSGIVICKSP